MSLPNIFTESNFVFPYLYKFPGQASDEKILFLTRESDVLLFLRRCLVIFAAVAIFLVGYTLSFLLHFLGVGIVMLIQVGAAIIAIVFLGIGWWWMTTLWQRSIAIITTMRLVKFVYTTPWNRHNLSLPLDMIVDTGAYSKGFLQALFHLGTFTARSSASSSGVATDDPDRVNKKYFYIENIHNFEDMHHYLHKVLLAYREQRVRIPSFRPFLPLLKGDARKEFMKSYPEYWS